MTNILEYIIILIQRFKTFVSKRPKMEPEIDTSEKTVLLYNPNISSRTENDHDDDVFGMFVVENPNKNNLRIKIFK